MTGLLTAAVIALSGARASPDRIALIVASEQPAPRATLGGSSEDAKRVAQVLADLGRFGETGVALLIDPEPERVLWVLEETDADEMVLFYFVGPATSGEVYTRGQRLAIREIRDVLETRSAPQRVAIFDTCCSGDATGTEPLSRGVVLSVAARSLGDWSTGDRRGSRFAHHWTMGLRGAADQEADGFVGVLESLVHAKARLAADTRFEVIGVPPITELTAPYRGATRLLVQWPGDAELELRGVDPDSSLVTLPWRAEPYTLALPPTKYVLRVGDQQRPVYLSGPGVAVVAPADWATPPESVSGDGGPATPPPRRRSGRLSDKELLAALDSGWLPEMLEPRRKAPEIDIRGRFQADSWTLEPWQAYTVLHAYRGSRASLERFLSVRDEHERLMHIYRCSHRPPLVIGPGARLSPNLAACPEKIGQVERADVDRSRSAVQSALLDALTDFGRRNLSVAPR